MIELARLYSGRRNPLGPRPSPQGGCRIGHDFKTDFGTVVVRGKVDVSIVSTEEGFSPLGIQSGFLQEDLHIPYEPELRGIADWNHRNNEQVSLVCLPTRNPASQIKGVILAPCRRSLCYTQRYGVCLDERLPPHRSFFYNITYEAIAYAVEHWGARRLAITSLDGAGSFHPDVATCNAEALAHYLDEHPDCGLESLVFVCCGHDAKMLEGIQRLGAEEQTTRHRPIKTTIEPNQGYELVHLDF